MRMLLPTRSLPLEFDIEVAGHRFEDVVASADVAEALSEATKDMFEKEVRCCSADASQSYPLELTCGSES